MVLRAMLSGAGHSVTEARCGGEVLGLVVRQRFDMILLDLRMPDIDGLEVTVQLRARAGWTADVPIIGVSADAMPETVQACLAAGMDAVLAKPVELDVLLSKLHRLGKNRHVPATA
jgi:CheY-like chemotaxis protein